jgi:hypothetical protein
MAGSGLDSAAAVRVRSAGLGLVAVFSNGGGAGEGEESGWGLLMVTWGLERGMWVKMYMFFF